MPAPPKLSEMSDDLVTAADVADRCSSACQTYRTMLRDIEQLRVQQEQNASQHIYFVNDVGGRVTVRLPLCKLDLSCLRKRCALRVLVAVQHKAFAVFRARTESHAGVTLRSIKVQAACAAWTLVTCACLGVDTTAVIPSVSIHAVKLLLVRMALQEAAEECCTSQQLLVDHVRACCTKRDGIRALASDVRQLRTDVEALHALLKAQVATQQRQP